MFLNPPTIDELQKLDMPALLDMLAYQTNLHFKLLKLEGVSSTTHACKQLIINIQTAIEIKKSMAKNATDSTSNLSFTQDTTPIDPPQN